MLQSAPATYHGARRLGERKVDFGDYEVDAEIYDEMFLPDGSARPHCRLLKEMLDELPGSEIRAVQEQVSRSFRDGGIVFTVYGENEAQERIIPVDCIPRLIASEEWNAVSAGLTQRIRAINLFLDDIYNEGRILADGVVPRDLILDCPQFRPSLSGFRPRHGVWVAVCGTDLIRSNDGFVVLEDNLRVPSGVSYMVANRVATKSSFRRLYRACRVREVEIYGRILRQTLSELAPENVVDPEIVVMTPGVYNSAFYEHMFLAREMGASLVEGRDLTVKNNRVYMKNVAGLRKVDVIYRRIDDDFIDPEAFRKDSLLGVPGLIAAARLGNVSLVNAPGTGVADDKAVYAYIPDVIRYYLGEEPLIPGVTTWSCRRPDHLEHTLDNLADLVVKRVGGSGGYGMLVGPASTAREREEYAREIRKDPADFISQPTLRFSRAPCLIGEAPEPRHVDLRPFVLTGRKTRIVPGGFCRVALQRGNLVVNSSQGGGGKDLWVVDT